jgi:hypothetical protein
MVDAAATARHRHGNRIKNEFALSPILYRGVCVHFPHGRQGIHLSAAPVLAEPPTVCTSEQSVSETVPNNEASENGEARESTETRTEASAFASENSRGGGKTVRVGGHSKGWRDGCFHCVSLLSQMKRPLRKNFRLEYQIRADRPWKPVWPESDNIQEVGERLQGQREVYPHRWFRIIEIEESVILDNDIT